MCKMKGSSNHEDETQTNAGKSLSESKELITTDQSNRSRGSADVAELDRERGNGTSRGVSSEPTPCDPSLSVEMGEVVIGCKYPGGIRIQLSGERAFVLRGYDAMLEPRGIKIGYTKLKKSIWEKMAGHERYKAFIAQGTIFLSPNRH